jgi:hypothetical protein
MLRVMLWPTWGPTCGFGRRAVTTPVLLLTLALVPALAACTGDDQTAGAPRPTPTTTKAAPDLSRRAAPYRVRLATVAGDIPRSRRAPYLRALAAPVRKWVDAGFVDGPWPRGRFTAAYAPFGRDVARQARRSGDLLTLRAHGQSFEHVVPERRWVVLSVSAVRGRVVGATARVNLRFLGQGEGARRVRVHVRGDLFLTRTRAHEWKIFGYDLDRWEERGAMTARTGGDGAARRGGDA